mmetsp:Transcript_10428/g.15047  ORF Transcript_10428/g.15047 Transcript_10428/m.15047 type:complete len:445 (-) Transcript_10428:1023-2357(-)|eukprot:CAMPEP_0172434512 /NCGR_PEP_ID=MMETSP1064-20121228/70671_1 /TAXON_ID=202472 /ORGANISM="Aulacoseira subarctica , Strain CCAP 1002/5" /LENGTH=444 /DNA_ID=CAMNT_0013182741 /DNA_START=3615 /DNA_END=4949 /DNA_ORIENTATION=-
MAGLTVLSRAAANAASKRAIISVKKGREFSALFNATEEFPDVHRGFPTPSKAGVAEVTKLSNGLVVVTEDGSSTSTVSLTFPNGGSSSETFSEAGAAFANKFFAYKSALDMSSIAILRALENGGASPFTSASRHSASVGYTCAPENAGSLVGSIFSQTASSYEVWDVQEAIKVAKEQAAAAASSPEVSLTEAIFSASYGGESTIGRPFCNAACTAAGLVSFRQRNYVFDGSILAATGVQHATFVKEVEGALGEVPSTAHLPPATAAANFFGGEARLFAPAGGSAHVALSVSATGSSKTLSVLKHCLSLSSGVSAFAVPGLVGVYGTAAAAEAGKLTDSLLAALGKSLTDDVIQRAKINAKAEAMFALENGSKSLSEYLTCSRLDKMTMNVPYMDAFTAASVATAFDDITSKEVHDAFIKKAGFSLAAVGEIQNVPSHRSISSKL